MDIRRILVHEGARLRALRLRALADAPTAFEQTLAEARTRTPEQWEARAREAATSETSVIFVAEDHGRWYGMAGGFVEEGSPETATLVSMWVAPSRRRSRLGAGLVQAVVEWARGRGVRRVQLWVTETNDPARSLYVRQGFVATDQTQPLSSKPSLREVLMVRELTSRP